MSLIRKMQNVQTEKRGYEVCSHTNILARRFSSCSARVKIVLLEHIVFVSMVWNFGSATLNAPLTDCDLAI